MNKTPRLSKYLTALLGICMAFLLAPSTLLAATLWWDASGGASWGVVSSWSTTGGGGSNPASIPGAYALANSTARTGDKMEETMSWTGGSDLSALAGTTIRLRFVLQDSDVYTMRFTN